MNLNGKMKKLQTAILHTGFIIRINSNQFYSVGQKRMITSYQICTPVFCQSKKGWKDTEYEILRTCSMPDIIMCLADIYKAVSAWH